MQIATQLDQLYSLCIEVHGNDDAIFDNGVGIKLTHSDKNEKMRDLISRGNWSYYNQLLLSGWEIETLWDNDGDFSYDDFVFQILVKLAVYIPSFDIVEQILSPVEPDALERHKPDDRVWVASFAPYRFGAMTRLLFLNTEGVRIIEVLEVVEADKLFEIQVVFVITTLERLGKSEDE